MTRGRAPNLALPLTKALAQQRDYRARKAANIARLEGENEVLRNENTQLRQDIAAYREGKPVLDRQQDSLSTKETSETSATATAIQHSPSSAAYLQLKFTYEQLEAEVRRKEQVLLSLREREKEAFARLEALLQQNMQVVGGRAEIAPQEAQSHSHGIYGTTMLKAEPVSHYPMPLTSGKNSPDGQTSVPLIRANSKSVAGYHLPSSVDTSGSQPLQSGMTPLSNRGSFSPDIDSYRARKRVRLSPGGTSVVGPYNGVNSRPYPPHPPQTYDHSATSPYLNPEYNALSAVTTTMQHSSDGRSHAANSRVHLPSSVPPFPNHEVGLPRREISEQAHSPFTTSERAPPSYPLPVHPTPLPFDDSRSRQLQPLPTPPTTGFFRVS